MHVLERTLLAGFALLFAVCLSLSAEDAWLDTPYPAFHVETAVAPSAYPRALDPSAAGALATAIQPGDVLLSAGGVDLRGAGPLRWKMAVARETNADRRIAIAYEHAGVRAETLAPVTGHRMFWPRLPVAVVFAIVGFLLLRHARRRPLVRIFATVYFATALLLAITFIGAPLETWFSIAVQALALGIAAPLSLRGALLFPSGVGPGGRLARFAPWVFALLVPLDFSRVYGVPWSRGIGVTGLSLGVVVFFASVLAILTRTYRRSDALERRQIRWLLFGTWAAAAPQVAAAALALFDPRFDQLVVLSAAALVFIPLSVLIAIRRTDVFDVDRLLNAATSYTALGGLLLVALFAGLPEAARAGAERLGVDPGRGQLAAAMAVAIGLVLADRWLRAHIERALFAERHRLHAGFEGLLGELSACRSAEQLLHVVGTRLVALLAPEIAVVYARGAHGFAPVFTSGAAIPPAFAAHGPLVALLETRAGPLATQHSLRAPGSAALSPFERAALETLGVPVVVPVRRGDALVAFLCLGPKRSRDVYTPTDLTLLAALADKVSGSLLGIEQAELIREGRQLQEALRRYVPGAMAEEISEHRTIEEGEREVTVLFVDMRDYTAYAETLDPARIFATVNRYTQAVSQIVRAHGGAIVEFNGDGMMTVFGAPRPLAHREAQAVAAAQELIAAVAALPTEPGLAPLQAGVGIATGVAFLGNVRAADRWIWTAIGNTTNLAARLQTLTRTLDAAIAIDTPTRVGAGETASRFEARPAMAVRGRSEPVDVWVLPTR
jgi:class 3 adenylate cyclase